MKSALKKVDSSLKASSLIMPSVIFMTMIDKVAKYEERLRGSNAFAITTVLDSHFKLKYILMCNHKKLKANILHELHEVQDEGNQAIQHITKRIESDIIASNIFKGNSNKILYRVGSMKKPTTACPTSYLDKGYTYFQEANVESYWLSGISKDFYPRQTLSLHVCN